MTEVTTAPTTPAVRRFVESNDILTDAAALHRRLHREGYLFVRGLIPAAEVLDLRRELLAFCAAAGWLRPGTDPMAGLTDHAPAFEGDPVHLRVYEKVQQCEAFHRLKLHPNVRQLMERLFDEPVLALPNTVGRLSFPRDNERATQPHQDWLYIQGSVETITTWVPLGEIPDEVGGLMVLAGSHKSGILFPRPAAGAGGHTVDVDPRLVWVAAPYQPGDVILFPALTVHAARPNLTTDRLRLSMDFRYVGVSHAICESNLPPHFHWAGPAFTWDNLDANWQDPALRRYWERVPQLRLVPHDKRYYAKG